MSLSPIRSGEGNGTPLQYSCLENPMEGGAWWAAVHGVAKGWTRLSDFAFTFMYWRGRWQPTPVFLPGESQRRWSLVGCRLWGRTESDRLMRLSSSRSSSVKYVCMSVKSLQSCPNLCDPMDCNPPGSSVHGILQARILERVAMPSSRGSPGSRD